MTNELYHHGILGMKWGVRRYQNKDGSLTSAGRKRYGKEGSSDGNRSEKTRHTEQQQEHKTPSYKELSDDDLRRLIDRATLEKRYIDLMKSMQPEKKKSKVLSVMGGILEKSVSNMGAQLVTYGIGVAVNKVAGKDIVNPKKGQKDK